GHDDVGEPFDRPCLPRSSRFRAFCDFATPHCRVASRCGKLASLPLSRPMKSYRCATTTLEGFIQQLAVAYIARGYWFWLSGRIPERKDPEAVDRTLIDCYEIDFWEWSRAARTS